MYPASHLSEIVFKASVAALLIAAVSSWVTVRYAESAFNRQGPGGAGTDRAAADQLKWRDGATNRTAQPDWSCFRNRDGDGGGSPGTSGKRFRLAGTFFSYLDDGQTVRKAIMDDLKDGVQKIVAEGDSIADYRISRVMKDRIVLRYGETEEQLLLSFQRGEPGRAGTEQPGGSAGGVGQAGSGAEGSDRFGGQRVGENRWVFQRQSLLSYYQELRDNPERLVKVFDSLRPVYNANKKIEGYQLKVEGEKEFFSAVGLNEGDVVRKVNSIPMTSRSRAEGFIKQFVSDKASAFVMDVERNGKSGKTERLIYQIR